MKDGLRNLIYSGIAAISLFSATNSSAIYIGLENNLNKSSISNIYINELVADPQKDHNNSGTVTNLDEFVELYNPITTSVSLDGWKLNLIDTTPETMLLDGYSINPNSYLVLQNPLGDINNSGLLELIDPQNNRVDFFQYGTWNFGLLNAPSANASDISNESLSRINFTGDNSLDFINTYATPGQKNIPEPSSIYLLGLGALALSRKINGGRK